MKLNYRDKVILGIVLAIAIVIAGYFALIKPKNEQIKNDNEKLDSLEVTEKDYKQRIAQIDPLKTTINEIVSDTNKITSNFVEKDKIDNPVLLDRYMQKFAVDNEVRLTSLAVGDMTESPLPFYYMEGKDIGSGLRALADINGDYQAEVDKKNAEADQLSARAIPNAITSQYGIEFKCTKENLWKFMDAIADYDKTVIINSVSYTRAKDEDDTKQPAEGQNNNDDSENQRIEPEDEIEGKMIISLYSVYDLPQVKVDEVQ